MRDSERTPVDAYRRRGHFYNGQRTLISYNTVVSRTCAAVHKNSLNSFVNTLTFLEYDGDDVSFLGMQLSLIILHIELLSVMDLLLYKFPPGSVQFVFNLNIITSLIKCSRITNTFFVQISSRLLSIRL